MKYIILCFFIFLSGKIKAANYYFSAKSGDDSRSSLQAQNPSTPWKTINKLNGFLDLKPGDSVLFNRDETFYGSLTINASGTEGKAIVYGAYGTGANPVITGFTTVSSWTNLGGNIWESSNAVSTLTTCNVVVINEMNMPMGRYPNTGYLTLQNFSGNTSITTSSLTGSPDWTGAEVVIKKNRWIINRNPITSQSGGTLTYSGGGAYNSRNNWGFFIQNDIRTLDTANEWYYNSSTNKIDVYSTSSPTNVQASSVDTLITMFRENYITFDNLSFTGANFDAFFIESCTHVTIINCNINFSYNGIHGGNYGGSSSANFILKNSTINHTNNNGIDLPSEFTSAMVSNNLVKNTGVIPGMGGSGDGKYQGISSSGTNSIIENNEVDSTGYNGIAFQGNSITISKNFINYFCLVKDDGGGIYTQSTGNGKIISYNIILNGIGSNAGTNNCCGFSSAMGIYCDDNSSGVQVLNNSVANISFAGIYLHDAHDIILEENTVYNCSKTGLLVKNDVNKTFIRNITIEKNIFFAREASQLAFNVASLHNDVTSFGTIDFNYYVRPLGNGLVFDADPTNAGGSHNLYSFKDWQTYSGYDAHSHKAPITIKNVSDLRFEYNATSFSKTVSLSGEYIDVTGKSYQGTIEIAPFSSAVLIRN